MSQSYVNGINGHASPPKVWLITGTSSGFGYELVLDVLARGDNVIATARSRSLFKVLPLASNRCHVLELDVRDSEEIIAKKAQEAISVWGRVDIIVNNAAFGVASPLEEVGVSALLNVYETNVFGPIRVTNAFLPHLRSRREGTIVFIGSRSAWRTNVPGGGAYTSSKAALHALADTYGVELQPFNIRVLTVQPGGFRTNTYRTAAYEKSLAEQSLEHKRPEVAADTAIQDTIFSETLFPAGSENHKRIADYDPMIEIGHRFMLSVAGKEAGDPTKAARIIVDVVKGDGVAKGKPFPKWLILGADCVRDIRTKTDSVLQNVDEWEAISTTTDFDV